MSLRSKVGHSLVTVGRLADVASRVLFEYFKVGSVCILTSVSSLSDFLK